MARRARGENINGWVVFDKPVDMTSTAAVSRIRRLFNARKAGHAGTLDPLASGLLPIALGEATKTVPFIMDGAKTYRFTIRWGIETTTGDREGEPVTVSGERPGADEIEAALEQFCGTIMQAPPAYSAIRIDGERAYDLARDGETVEIAPRPVVVHRFVHLGAEDADHSGFEVDCGKGTYVRALARDLGRALGCGGHVASLRRTRVGPFNEDAMISLEKLEELRHIAAASGPAERNGGLTSILQPVETALDDIPALAVSKLDAARLRQGQAVLVRGGDAPVLTGTVYAMAAGTLVALGEIRRGELVPKRVFNLAG
jgi:tRNA pseudouridine55 synthase